MQPGVFSFSSFDGRMIAYRILGERGRPTLMIHGFMADAELNWIQPGIAGAIVAAGGQAILPDLRGHGGSKQGADPAAYPEDALARDQLALLAHLGLDAPEIDLVGYSLGARTAVRMMAAGARPRRVALGGMGGAGIVDVTRRQAQFMALINRSPAAPQAAVAFVDRMIADRKLDRAELILVLAQQRSTPPEVLATLRSPTLVIAGERDADNGSPEELAALLPIARVRRTGGDHLSAVSDPGMALGIAEFLAAASV